MIEGWPESVQLLSAALVVEAAGSMAASAAVESAPEIAELVVVLLGHRLEAE